MSDELISAGLRECARDELQESASIIDRINSGKIIPANDNRSPFHVKLLNGFAFTIVFLAVIGWLS